MKKLIAILAIMIVLVGAVFAESHTLNVKCVIDPVIPQFALRYDATDSNTTPSAFSSANTTSYVISAKDTTAGADLMEDNAITVSVVVLNNAKQKQGYTLTFTGGEFDTSKGDGFTSLNINGVATVANPTSVATATTIDAQHPVVGLDAVTATGNALKVPFNGTRMTAADDVVLGTATYSYGVAWNTVDPGTYKTNIILTITEGISN